jgi:DNA-binding transcriptional LysR family regulator
MKLDPLSFQLFVSVVEEGTIAAAATRHHIAPAAVSKRLSELELQFNTQLLMRSNKGITATAAGMTLLNLARGVLNDLDNLASQMHDFSNGTRGSVRVLANISVITEFMPAALKSFLSTNPLVQVSLEERVSTAVVRGVAENIADIGIFTQVPYGDDLEIYNFRTDELVVIVPTDHPLSDRSSIVFSDALDFEFVGLRVGSSLNFQMVKAASELGRSLKQRIQVNSYDAQCLMVEAGLGIGILPKTSVEIYSALAIKKIELNEPWAHRQLNICVRSYDSLSVAAKLLFDHFQNNR